MYNTVSKFVVIYVPTMLLVHAYFINFIKINEMLETFTGRIIHFGEIKRKECSILKLLLNARLVVVMI